MVKIMLHKNIFIFILLLFILNCSTNKVSKTHGTRSLDVKYEKLFVNKTNKNDLRMILGPPSSVSQININKWIYIERKKTNQSLFKLGLKKIEKNNVLIVEFDNKGLIKNKKLLDLNDMNDLTYVTDVTEKEFKQDNFLYNVFSSLREKINAPTRNRRKN